MRIHWVVFSVVLLAGCTDMGELLPQLRKSEAPAEEPVDEGAPLALNDTPLDVVEGDQAGFVPPAPAGEIGETVVSLGNPAEPGMWLKTPLVTQRSQGRVRSADGKIVAVTLIPLDAEEGAGSRLSLSAMQALGLGLSDLAPVMVLGAEQETPIATTAVDTLEDASVGAMAMEALGAAAPADE
jgi:hypothetical protein